jgi:hypothetical protein
MLKLSKSNVSLVLGMAAGFGVLAWAFWPKAKEGPVIQLGDGASFTMKPGGDHSDLADKLAEAGAQKIEANLGSDDFQQQIIQARTKQLDEFDALPGPAERRQYLDKTIDDQEAMRKEIEKLENQPQDQTTTDANGNVNRVVRRVSAATPELRKTMRETMPAELQTRIAEFTRQLNERRKERGLPPSEGGTAIKVMMINDNEPEISVGPAPK